MIKKIFKHKKVVQVALLALFLCTSIGSFSQDAKATLNKLAKQMFVEMNDRNYDAILAKTHPKVFEFASKEQMKTVIKSIFEGNSEYAIEIPKTIPDFKTSEVFKGQNNLEYGMIAYDMTMKMTFHKQKFGTEEKEMMTTVMEQKGMSVTFLSENTMNIIMNNRITVILKEDATDNQWVMVNYDPHSPLFGKILAAEVLENAKKYKESIVAKE